MEAKIKTMNNIIKVIDIFGYVSAIYEFFVKHNFGIGIILTLVSLFLSVYVYIMSNSDKLKDTYESIISDINKSSYFRSIVVMHIAMWFIILIAWVATSFSFPETIVLGFILYNMPILLALETRFFCYITKEVYRDNYQKLSFLVSLILSIILFFLFLIDEEATAFYLILELVFQCIPLFYSMDF